MANTAHAQSDDENTGQTAAPRPVDTIRVGPVEIPIWRNRGAKGDFYSAGAPQVSYKDENNKWQEGTSYGMGDLLFLSKAADMAARAPD